MADETNNTEARWLFPDFLLGDMRATRQAVKKMAKMAMETGAWPDCPGRFDVRVSDCPIVVERAIRGYAPDKARVMRRPTGWRGCMT